MLRQASLAEQGALHGVSATTDDLAALTSGSLLLVLRLEVELPSRIESGKFRPQGVAAVGDGAQPTPHIVLPGKGLGHDLPRHGVPLGRYRPGVLVLQVGVARLDLAQQLIHRR